MSSSERAASLLQAQNEFLRMIVRGDALGDVLHAIIAFMERESGRALCSVLLLTPDGEFLRWGAAPSLPVAYNRGVDWLRVGPNNGSCGTAIFRREPVQVTDIETDPLWAAARDLALTHGLRACTSVPLLDRHEQPLGTFAFYYRERVAPNELELQLIETARDLTTLVIERDLRDQERAAMVEQLRAAVRARDEFLSIAAHELRTPMAALQLHLDAMKRISQRQTNGTAELLDRLVPKVDAASGQVKRLDSLVNRLLDVSRITTGRLVLDLDTLDLRELVLEVACHFDAVLASAGSSLSLAAPDPVIGAWDRARLDAVVTNLLSNAVKFGQGKPLAISLRHDDDSVSIEVADQGIGIDPEAQQRIFERFERAVPEKHYGGLGLGLWISRQIVEAHGGTITVHSTPGLGSTFTVTLPRRLTASRPAPERTQATHRDQTSSTEWLIDSFERTRG